MALTNCPECGKEISDQADKCPNCGAPTRKKAEEKSTKKKTRGCLGTVLIVFALLILIGAFGSMLSSDDKPTKVDSGDSAEATEEEKTEFAVGETASLNDVKVTLVSAEESNGTQFLAPEAGNIYINLSFEITNNSDRDITVSSMLNFEAYCNDYSVNQSISGAASNSNGKVTLDGNVASGKKMNGIITYEVPEDYQRLEVSFTPDFWKSKDIKFVVTK